MLAVASYDGPGTGFESVADAHGYAFVGSYNGSDYYLSDTVFFPPSGWEAQDALAQEYGGHLADILSETENDFITNLWSTLSLTMNSQSRALGWG